LGAENIIFGRCRWSPDGRRIAFVGVDENGLTGIFDQEFVPGQDTSATRRRLAGFDPDSVVESFGISPDGGKLTLATLDYTWQLVLADGVSLDIR
jgi:Tol biopolymer transport system component